MSTWNFGDFTREQADSYFLTSPMYSLWIEHGELLRTQAVNDAERIIWAYLGGYYDLQHPDDIKPKQRVRHDYAIFEQALSLLQTSGAQANGESTAPKWMANNEDAEAEKHIEEKSYPVKVSQRAKFWLGQNTYNPRIARG